MNPWEFLLKYLPTHWPDKWQGSYSQTAGGPSTTVTVTSASHTLEDAEPTIEFTFTDAETTHIVKGIVVNLHGDAHVFLDADPKTDHPVLNVGLAVHLPFSTYAIVHLIFSQNGQRHDYRFEGKIN